MSTKYFKGIQKETSICKIFQKYIEKKRSCKSYLKKRIDKQAPIDYIGRLYENDKTICSLTVEIKTLQISKKEIEEGLGYVMFQISKLNELMQFWRMGKECYIVYLLKDEVYFLSWDYYLKHNFEIGKNKKGNYIKLPIQSFIYGEKFENH